MRPRGGEEERDMLGQSFHPEDTFTFSNMSKLHFHLKASRLAMWKAERSTVVVVAFAAFRFVSFRLQLGTLA